MELSAFTCLIGLNGAGKTTVLQAIDFLAQLMNGHLTEWLKQRDWKATDLLCKLVKKRTVGFTVDLRLDNGKQRSGREISIPRRKNSTAHQKLLP